MSTGAGYVRVYYTVRTDDRFAAIYGDDRHLATWLRLLLDADAVWPAPASIPRSARPASLRALVDAGLVELLPSDHFLIHGLHAERTRRAESAKVGGFASGRSRSVEQTPNDCSTIGEPRGRAPSLAKPSQAEPTRAPGEANEEDVAVSWLARHQCLVRPGDGWHRRLIRLVGNHGSNAVIAAFERLGPKGTERTYILGAENALDLIAPAPKVDPKAIREAEDRRRGQRELERTRRMLDEQNGARLNSDPVSSGAVER